MLCYSKHSVPSHYRPRNTKAMWNFWNWAEIIFFPSWFSWIFLSCDGKLTNTNNIIIVSLLGIITAASTYNCSLGSVITASERCRFRWYGEESYKSIDVVSEYFYLGKNYMVVTSILVLSFSFPDPLGEEENLVETLIPWALRVGQQHGPPELYPPSSVSDSWCLNCLFVLIFYPTISLQRYLSTHWTVWTICCVLWSEEMWFGHSSQQGISSFGFPVAF